MDALTFVALLTIGYLVTSLVMHRLRISASHRDGLELNLLRRIDSARVPEAAEAALEACQRAEVARVQGDPDAREREAHTALALISKAGGAKSSAGLAYLAAQVRLAHLVTPLNLEVMAIATLVRLRRALKRFGPAPELHIGLAHAHAVLGQSTAALDALGRAVYYANGAPFYLELVLASEYVERVRPRLRQQCLDAQPADE